MTRKHDAMPEFLTVEVEGQQVTYSTRTPEGQAALVALGYAGPYPVPEGVTLGGYSHGTALTEHEALTLAGLPNFVDLWVLCPSGSGGAPYTLLWGDSATNEQLERSSGWAELTAASLRAERTASGSA